MKRKPKFKWLLCLLTYLFFGALSAYSQTNVAITIDDVPNTRQFKTDNFQSQLLDKLDSFNIPVAVFINEGLLYKTDSITRNFELLVNWAKKDFVTLGNHTFSHPRYSDVGFEPFKADVEKGEFISRQLAGKYNKPLQYFRFPFNDLGKDSVQQILIHSFLREKKYISTPFTVESSDWMFNYIYEYYLSHSEPEKAKEIGELYVSKTIDYFHFFDSLSTEKYGRKVNQIFLCHDNALNSKFLGEIVRKLKEENYNFISLETALQDTVYLQENQYYQKWGVSWFYRWMPVQQERTRWMRLEPDLSLIESLYRELTDKE